LITAAQIRDLLKGNAAFGPVGGAGDFASAVEQLKASKSLFVMPPTLAAQPNTTGTEVVRQRTTARFRVVAGFKVYSATKEDQSGDVDAVRDALMAALIGWTPDPSVYSPANFVSWSAFAPSPDGATVFFAADFFTTFYLRNIP